MNGALCFLAMLFLLMGIKVFLWASVHFSGSNNGVGYVRLGLSVTVIGFFCIIVCNRIHEDFSVRTKKSTMEPAMLSQATCCLITPCILTLFSDLSTRKRKKTVWSKKNQQWDQHNQPSQKIQDAQAKEDLGHMESRNLPGDCSQRSAGSSHSSSHLQLLQKG